MSNLNERVCKEWLGLEEGTVEFVSELSKLDWSDAMREEEAVIYFTNASAQEQEEEDNKDQFRPYSSSEWQEDVVLIGEEISDYEATMEAFLEECYQDSL
jgi:hypothetical protein